MKFTSYLPAEVIVSFISNDPADAAKSVDRFFEMEAKHMCSRLSIGQTGTETDDESIDHGLIAVLEFAFTQCWLQVIVSMNQPNKGTRSSTEAGVA